MALRRLEGKVCVITASTDGIGLAVAKRLGLEGAKVVVSSRQQANVDEAVKCLKNLGIDVLGLVCHVANAGHRKRLFEETIKKFGGIDILVSNAAVNPAQSAVFKTSEEVWDKIFEVNVKSAFLLAQEAKPYMIKRGGGSIVFISSVGGFNPMKFLGAYAVSKTALFGLTKAAALDCVKDNIRVNCVAPGAINTNFAKTVSDKIRNESTFEVRACVFSSCLSPNP